MRPCRRDSAGWALVSTSDPTTLTPRGQRTRTKLLDAAERVFGESGFERASIVEITRTAGVAQGTFYVYFESKKAIFAQLVDTLGRQLRQDLAEATAGLDSRMAMEEAGCDAFLRFIEEHRHFYRIIRQAEFVDEALYRDYYDRVAQGYIVGLRKAMDAGEFIELEPEAVAYALMGIFDFLGMRWVLWDGRLPPRKIRQDVLRFISRGLRRDE